MEYQFLHHRQLKAVSICLFVFSLTFVTGLYAEETGDAGRGYEAYNARSCSFCHSINNKGGDIGPDLTQVTMRRSEEWLNKWLKDPPSILPDTDMSKIPWKSTQEILDIISYLKSFKRDAKANIPSKYPTVEAGRLLVEEYDCKACHIIKGEEGLERYPELTSVGSKMAPGILEDSMKDHQTGKEGTFLPAFTRMTDDERKAIVSYLGTHTNTGEFKPK